MQGLQVAGFAIKVFALGCCIAALKITGKHLAILVRPCLNKQFPVQCARAPAARVLLLSVRC